MFHQNQESKENRALQGPLTQEQRLIAEAIVTLLMEAKLAREPFPDGLLAFAATPREAGASGGRLR